MQDQEISSWWLTWGFFFSMDLIHRHWERSFLFLLGSLQGRMEAWITIPSVPIFGRTLPVIQENETKTLREASPEIERKILIVFGVSETRFFSRVRWEVTRFCLLLQRRVLPFATGKLSLPTIYGKWRGMQSLLETQACLAQSLCSVRLFVCRQGCEPDILSWSRNRSKGSEMHTLTTQRTTVHDCKY